MPLLALLVIIALAFIAAAILIWWLFASQAKRNAALGTLPNGSTPASATIIESWTTAPGAITVGTNTTFVLTVQSAQVAGMLAVSGRLYAFDVQPSANISIVTITPAGPGPNFGSTTAAGTITVVIVANTLPPISPPNDIPTGVLVAKQVNAPTSAPAIIASFTVQ